MQKWVYREHFRTCDGSFLGDLSKAGQEGWELCGIIPKGNENVLLIYKKPEILPPGVSDEEF